MSRFLFLSVLTLGLAAYVTSNVLAAEETTQTKTGTIKSVDSTAKTFVLKPENRELTFKITDKTTYKKDDKEAKMADVVKADAKVTVTYTRSGDDRTATKVEMTTKKEKE